MTLLLLVACHLFESAQVECAAGERCARTKPDDSAPDSEPDSPQDSEPDSPQESELPPNDPPEIQSVSLSPAEPGRSDTITATVAASDPNGDALTYTYDWILNGKSSGAADKDTLSSADHVPGDVVGVLVTVSDGRDAVQLASSTVEVTGPSFYRMSHTTNIEVDAGLTTLTGTWLFSMYAEGQFLGHVDCTALYDLSSTGSETCRNCDFAFTVKATQDAAQSQLNSLCDGLDTTGRISMAFTSAYDSLDIRNESPNGLMLPLNIQGLDYYGDYYDYAFYYYFNSYANGDYANYNGSYIRKSQVDYWTDNNGIFHVSAYTYMFTQY